MTTRFDDDPEFGPGDPSAPEHDPDDPLLIVLGPAPAYLGAPPGRYEEIRRTATRRRRVRTAAGVGMACVIAALVALPLSLTTVESPRSPTVPQAPPPATSPPPRPTPSVPTVPSVTTPSPSAPPAPATVNPQTPSGSPAGASRAPSEGTPVPTPADPTAPGPAQIAPTPSWDGAVAAPSGTVAP